MIRVLLIAVYLLSINSLWAVKSYSYGDVLYVIGNNVNFRAEPNANSKVLTQLRKGELVNTLQTKYDKSGDTGLSKDTSSWKSAITGKWAKVKYDDQVGYVFDAYLSAYDFGDFLNSRFCFSRDTITVPSYQTYTRTIYINGVIVENGLGMEWGKETFFIPDFSFEEAVLLLKPGWIDKKYGQQTWEISKDRIKLEESSDTSWRELEIVRHGEYIIIHLADGV